MTVRRSWWIVYGAGAAVVLLALGWITAEMLRLERAELTARADAEHQEALRLALWRMDSWLAPRLAQEAARPYGDYEPFRPTRNLYSGERLEPIDGSQWLAPSPLLSFQSDIIPLHFQFSEQKGFTSPQAPVGGQRDAVADNNYLEVDQLAANDVRLEKLAQNIDVEELVACATVAQETPTPGPPAALTKAGGGAIADPTGLESQEWQAMKNMAERSRRGEIDQQVKQAPRQQMAQTAVIETPDEAPSTDDAPDIGPLVPIWIDSEDGEGRQLVLARRVQLAGESVYQGFLFDWTTLRGSLLEQISDLFGRAALVPVEAAASSADLSPVMLATIPVALEVPAGVPGAGAAFTPARFTLILTWLAVLTGIGAVGMTLRSSIAFGQKRSRFASAVTHELRTPLTTFRMYTEMLSEGMVTDEKQRATYLRTLKDESGRLSTLVENVLAYARIEEGRHASHVEAVTVAAMLDRLTPALTRRAESAGLALEVRTDVADDTIVRTDVEAVGQILFNLVDNACKYACNGEDRTLELHVAKQPDKVRMEVRDHGPGVSAARARDVFTPFERGDEDHGEHPGIGLGLALSRNLARDLGGELSLCPPNGEGACFRLELPL